MHAALSTLPCPAVSAQHEQPKLLSPYWYRNALIASSVRGLKDSGDLRLPLVRQNSLTAATTTCLTFTIACFSQSTKPLPSNPASRGHSHALKPTMAAAAVSSPPPLPSSAPPPSNNNQRRTSSGLLHNVKRAVFGPNKSTIDDSEFKTAQDDFTTLNQHLHTLRSNLNQYNKAALTLTTSARATTQTFGDLLKEAARPNPYSTTLLTSTHAHNELVDKVEASGGYTRDVQNVVEQQTEAHKALTSRIEERNKLRQDWLYYQKKVEGLQKEREDRQLKGKAEKQAEVEKMERNNVKLTDTGDRYRLYNAELMHDLQMLFISRLKTYGPCLQQFVTAEKRLSSDYYACMTSVDREDGRGGDDGRGVDGLSINVSGAAAQRGLVVAAEHSPMIDQPIGALSSPFDPFDVTPSPIGGLTPTNVLRKHSGAHFASAQSFSSARPTTRHVTSDGHNDALPPYYPYEEHNGGLDVNGHNAPAASAPMQPPPTHQPFSFSQPAAAGGPRVDVYSDPFANASVNPFDDLDEFAAIATPAQAAAKHNNSNNHSSFSTFSSAASSTRPSSTPATVPEYHPAPYVPAPAVVVAAPSSAVPMPSASVVMLGGNEIDGEVEEEDRETDEDAEGPGGAVAEAVGEEEPEGIPSLALAASARTPAASLTPAPAAATPAPSHPPAAAPAVLVPPPSGFAAMHSAAAPAVRPPAMPGRLPTSMPPSPPASRPAPPAVRPVQWIATVSPPRSPHSAQSDNPFDDD